MATTETTTTPSPSTYLDRLVTGRLWIPAAIGALIVAAIILGKQVLDQGQDEATQAAWERLTSAMALDPAQSKLTGEIEALAAVAADVGETAAGPWARLVEISARIDAFDHEGAKAALVALRTDHPDHFLVRAKLDFGDGKPLRSLVTNMERFVEDQVAWRQANEALFGNPPAPVNAQKVLLRTSLGDITVALYENRAPRTAANFLKLCEQGFYDKTTFYSIQAGTKVEGGDPHTRPSENKGQEFWGSGGRDRGIEDETNDLNHFRGVLATAAANDPEESSSCRWRITTSDAHQLNGEGIVFGQVISGMEVVEEIEKGELESGTPFPKDPVVLLAAEIL